MDDHPWQSFDTEIRMETPISSVVLSGTPIKEHVERIMMDMLMKQPNACLGETLQENISCNAMKCSIGSSTHVIQTVHINTPDPPEVSDKLEPLNEWLKDLNNDEYRALEWGTKCEHCRIPWHTSSGPPLACKGGLRGQWTCLQCADIVEIGYYCTKG
jgi:hypothetical protein